MQKPLTTMIGRYVTPATNEAFNALVGMGYRPERGRRARAKYDCINTDGVICDYLRDPSEYYKQAYFYNGKFYDQPYEEFTITQEKDIAVLRFIYDRLKFVYEENPNYDYMRALKSIIEKEIENGTI